LSASKGHICVVEFLLSHGANRDINNRIGNTPIHLSAENGFIDVIDFLLKQGTNINIENKKVLFFLITKLHFIWQQKMGI